jgi:hypothetical protein
LHECTGDLLCINDSFNFFFDETIPSISWDESVKKDLKEWNISKDLAMDMSAWRLAINVPEP